ncbi:MAG: phenylalanine--tRNA ligase subunit alpha [Candidatus Moranbacteria bacterium]|nr:phenylalanine--tRNA ligase subunit alpha [Candidatus Moranbacteria bacterium]
MRKLISQLQSELEKVSAESGRLALWRKYLGKDGIIKKELKKLGTLAPEKRKGVALKIQKIYAAAADLINAKEEELKKTLSEGDYKKQAEELGFTTPKIGHIHPLTQTIRMMNRFFTDLGYSIASGPEIETDEYCFQRLNVPQDHPARDMQDTIYIQKPDYLLRTQTSSIESHILAENKPPFKVVCAGRVYRNEKVNKSNHFIFHHYQGTVVLPKVSLKDLFGTFNYLFQKMYGPEVVVRYRNKYYPEVEPGVGPDMHCFNCKGKGCRLCKEIGWIEMGGAGIIHPTVLKMAGINPKKWMGFAFGLGLDRWAMAKYRITDIRTLLGGNLCYKYYENENTLL